MSEIATAAAKPATKLRFGETILSGRIRSARQFQAQGKNQVETCITLPADDAYSSPATVAVVSDRRLGTVGEELQVTVKVGGYADSYKTREGEAVQTARNVLRAVEA